MLKRIVRLGVFVAVLIAGLGGVQRTAHAESAGEWAGRLSDALRRQDFEKIFLALMELKDEDFVKGLADDPAACHTAMRGVAKSVGKLATEADNFAKRVLEHLGEVEKALVAAHPDEPVTLRARGALAAARAHFGWVTGKEFEFDDWERAVSYTAKSYEKATGPVSADEADAAADACVWMRELYKHPKFKADPSLLSAIEPNVQAVIKVATGSTGEDAHAEVVRCQGRFLDAQRAFRAGGASKAGPVLEALFAALTPKTEGGDAVATSLYNDCVNFAQSYKIPTRADFKFGDAISAGGLIYHVPAGSRWRSEPSDSDREAGSFYAYDTMGRRVRSVTMEIFRWDTNYIVSDREKTGGDNAKGLAKMLVKFYKSDFTTFKEVPLQKSSFAKKLPPGSIFEMVGVDGNNNYLRVRGIYVKGKERQVTFGIMIKDLEDFGKTDAEMEAILDTFEEKKAK